MGNVFSAIINGIEHVAQDIESLVSKAASDLEELGILVTEGVSWLVKFLIQEGEDPVAAISRLSSRISSMGGDVVGTLEELVSGIMSDGLTGFAQKKVSQALTPMQEALQKNSAQGLAIAQVHQTTLKTVQARLDALTLQGNASGLAWQGYGADAMYTSFGDISGVINDLTVAFENGGPQDKLNIICGGALAGIVVVGGIVLLCEFVVVCIVAIAGLVTGPGDLAILGGGAALMAETLEVIETLIIADLLAWLVGTVLIYTVNAVKELEITIVFSTTKETSTGQRIRVRPLKSREVKNLRADDGTPFEQEKARQGYPANAEIYVDPDGNYWIGMPGSDYVEPFP